MKACFILLFFLENENININIVYTFLSVSSGFSFKGICLCKDIEDRKHFFMSQNTIVDIPLIQCMVIAH